MRSIQLLLAVLVSILATAAPSARAGTLIGTWQGQTTIIIFLDRVTSWTCNPMIESLGYVAGTSDVSPANAANWVSCDQSWAHVQLGDTYSCTTAGAGGWCRDWRIAYNRNAAGTATCTVNAPGVLAYDSVEVDLTVQ